MKQHGVFNRYRYEIFLFIAGSIFSIVFDVFTMRLRLWELLFISIGPGLGFIALEVIAKTLFKKRSRR